jgi:hypothetical protein
MFEVKDGVRTLQFNGELLAKSSSQRRDSTRWVEFELYRTDSGSYILSRIGVSLVYHGAACSLVAKYKLIEASASDLHDDAIPCEECDPDESLDLVFPEKYRYWAQVSDMANAVLDALYQYDTTNGAYYLTGVAKRLLQDASKVDSNMRDVYTVEIVP